MGIDRHVPSIPVASDRILVLHRALKALATQCLVVYGGGLVGTMHVSARAQVVFFISDLLGSRGLMMLINDASIESPTNHRT
ncbi:hypothetical protein C7212DRAFT_339126 [Tuber magnatum]|uniref:Uncharacterized protein n=1 Tax=Tuber magnatum TaxID=42249 RepID=A0A317SD05_9PEZI|nr:hypothetical protein C7212DRAFT_339126 [Tuber magnatum]